MSDRARADGPEPDLRGLNGSGEAVEKDSGSRLPRTGRVVRALAAQFFVNGFVYATFVSRLPEIRDRAGVPVSVLGLVLTVSSLAGLAGSLLSGRLLTRVGSKGVMAVGGLLYVAALPGIGWSTSAALLLAALVLLGFVDVFVDVAMNVQGSAVSARRPAPVLSRLHGLWSLGTVIGGLVAARAAAVGVPVPVHFLACAGVLAVVLLLVVPGLLPTDERHPEASGSGRPRRRGLARAGVALGLAGAASVALDVAPGEWATLRLTDDLQAPAGLAATAFVAYTTGVTAGRFGGDWLVQRIGRTRLLRAGAVTSMAGLLAACLLPDPVAVLVGFLVAGLGVSVLAPQLADAAARAPGAPGSGFVVLFAGHRVASLSTPALVGLLAGVPSGSVGTAILAVAVPWAVVLLLVARRVAAGRVS